MKKLLIILMLMFSTSSFANNAEVLHGIGFFMLSNTTYQISRGYFRKSNWESLMWSVLIPVGASLVIQGIRPGFAKNEFKADLLGIGTTSILWLSIDF